MGDKSRLNFIVSEAERLITIRPIGSLSPMTFVEQLFENYGRMTSPWTYSRINDLRRWECELDPVARGELTQRWAEATAGQDYTAYVAVVTADPTARFRQPRLAAKFPHETVCDFTDYHEGVGWLLASDRDAYLATLGAPPVRRRDAHAIFIE